MIIQLDRHPFLDPFGAMQRPDSPLTVHEYDEFGHPDDSEALSYIRSYSPCSNIGQNGTNEGEGVSAHRVEVKPKGKLGVKGSKGGEIVTIYDTEKEDKQGEGEEKELCDFPAMFVSTGLLDTKVSPLESLRWVRGVRAVQRKRNKHRPLDTDTDPAPASQSLVLLHITSDCGHEGPSDPLGDLRLKALEIAFMEKAIESRKKTLKLISRNKKKKKEMINKSILKNSKED